jgi:hypothetical protein
MENADCKMAALAGTPRCPVFSAFHTPQSAIRNPLVASAPAKWLSAKKNIYERTHLWPKTNFAQPLVNENVFPNRPSKSVGILYRTNPFIYERTHFKTPQEEYPKNNLSREGCEECEGRNPRSKLANSEMYPEISGVRLCFASTRQEGAIPSANYRFSIYDLRAGCSIAQASRFGVPKAKRGHIKTCNFAKRSQIPRRLVFHSSCYGAGCCERFLAIFPKGNFEKRSQFLHLRFPIADLRLRSVE